MGSSRAQGETVDVVILTVIPAELAAARRVLQLDDDCREKHGDGTVYFRGTVRSELANRDYAVVLTCIGAAGNSGAAAAATRAIEKFHPRAVLLMGIAAGIRGKIRIGEVVFSDRVVAYEPAALTISARRTKAQPRPEIDRAPHTMIQDVVNYRQEPSRLCDAFDRAGGVIPIAPAGREAEFRAYVASAITARQGTIASGEKLLRNPAKLLAVRELHDKIEVGEMEAAGIVDACRPGTVPWLVIRGISDFGDEFKDDRFHTFASCAAAAVLHDFVTHGLDLGTASSPDARYHVHAPFASELHDTSASQRAAPIAHPLTDLAGLVASSDDPVSKWLRFGLDRHGSVRIVGFGNTPILIELDRIFVSLDVYADRARKGSGPDARYNDEGFGRGGAQISLDKVLEHRRNGRTCVALIGDPGAGKTTLLRYLFRRVVLDEDLTGPLAHLRGLHPMLVRLATVTDVELVARGLEKILKRICAEEGYVRAGPALLARPGQRFLFLLDGLDEVRNEPTRERICGWLNQEIDHWPDCGFVVTSRPAAWARTPTLGTRFLPVSVQGLRGDAVAEYVRRWFRMVVDHFCGAVDSPESVEAVANEKATALLKVLASQTWRSSARLLEMTANPLMLSTLCLAHYKDTRLPERRGELYERTLELLIEVWAGERPGGPTLRLETTRLILQPLAYAMHEQDQPEFSIDDAAGLVENSLSQIPEVREVAPTPERFLDLLRDECGVLKSRDLKRIEFVHLSFQEYLAACHISDRGLGRVLADRASDPRWEEVILLAMSRPSVFEPFMTGCLERGDVDVMLLRECLRETLEIRPAPFEAAFERTLAQLRGAPSDMQRSLALIELWRLFALVQGYDLPSLIERARSVVNSNDPSLNAVVDELVEILGPMDDAETTAPREGHGFVEPATGMRFVWIPGGCFLMGSSREPGQPNYDPGANHDEIPVHSEQLAGFWMSVYPVTNEQYRRFVTETGHVIPLSFSDRRFNDPAQPVVAMSWDDACAFAAWLTTRLTNTVARLPTEAEWEYAARGTDGRRYPWGNEPPDASRATFGQSGDTGRPTVIGYTLGGKSPFGVHELAGNVLEWCLDTRTEDPAGRTRAVRGGSWLLWASTLRSAGRGGFTFDDRGTTDLGFRVVCRPG